MCRFPWRALRNGGGVAAISQASAGRRIARWLQVHRLHRPHRCVAAVGAGLTPVPRRGAEHVRSTRERGPCRSHCDRVHFSQLLFAHRARRVTEPLFFRLFHLAGSLVTAGLRSTYLDHVNSPRSALCITLLRKPATALRSTPFFRAKRSPSLFGRVSPDTWASKHEG